MTATTTSLVNLADLNKAAVDDETLRLWMSSDVPAIRSIAHAEFDRRHPAPDLDLLRTPSDETGPEAALVEAAAVAEYIAETLANGVLPDPAFYVDAVRIDAVRTHLGLAVAAILGVEVRS